jgi:DNA-binding beta-propeller fold protein YncE
MKTITRTVWAAAAAIGAGVLFSTAPASASPAYPGHQHDDTGSVFVQTDNLTGNAIVAYRRGSDGRLSQAGTYETGGRGGQLDGSAVDHTASQGSLAYDRAAGLLYAVNAGSDTVTVFGVHGDRLDRLQVLRSGGDFPVSVAVRGHQVYVLNALGGGTVAGFERFGDRLFPVRAWTRQVGLDPAATPQFVSTPGQVAVTPDGGELIVTTKAGGNSVLVYPLSFAGTPAAAPVVTGLAGAVPFAVSFDAAGHLLLAEAGPNAVASFAVRPNGTLAALGSAPTGQAATCWIVRIGDHAYLSNAGSGTVTDVAIGHRGSLTAVGNTATGPGTVDSAATPDGRYLYVQTGRAGGVDGFRVGRDGSLTPIGSVTVPGAAGGEGIVATG